MDPEQERYLSYGEEIFPLMGPLFYTSITVSCLYDTSCTFMDPQKKTSWPLGQEVFITGSMILQLFQKRHFEKTSVL